MLPFLQSLTLEELHGIEDLRAVVRAHFGRRREDLPLLDRALWAFLRQGDHAWGQPQRVEPKPSESESELTMQEGLTLRTRQLSVLDPSETDSAAEELEVASYSRRESLRHKDIEALTETEMAEVRRLIRLMRIPAGTRRTRRLRPGGSDRLDLRRLLRGSLKLDGEPLWLYWRKPRLKPRPIVLLCDISGSMERYTRVLLHFIYAIEQASEKVEAFVFATRLTRVTRQLRGHDPDRALDRLMRAVEDWSGGTRIGEALETFNRRYARRVLAGGANVVVISDGWDRGDPVALSQSVARLQRSCYRLIWMNPLLGAPGYEPLTVGLKAALPFVDDFIPAHNLASLEALGRLLLETEARRPFRRQIPIGAAAAAIS